MAFGVKQLLNPTPRNTARFINIMIAVNSAVTMWLGTADFVSSYTAKVFGSILSLATLILVAIKPFFGVETTSQKVDIKDVTEMKEP